jgi:hypothetical protein
MRRERLFWPLVFLCFVLFTLLCFHRVLGYGLTDKDTLMHITEAGAPRSTPTSTDRR